MIVILAMAALEYSIAAMSVSRYGVMTTYRIVILDLLGDIVWLMVRSAMSRGLSVKWGTCASFNALFCVKKVEKLAKKWPKMIKKWQKNDQKWVKWYQKWVKNNSISVRKRAKMPQISLHNSKKSDKSWKKKVMKMTQINPHRPFLI